MVQLYTCTERGYCVNSERPHSCPGALSCRAGTCLDPDDCFVGSAGCDCRNFGECDNGLACRLDSRCWSNADGDNMADLDDPCPQEFGGWQDHDHDGLGSVCDQDDGRRFRQDE